MKDGTPPTISPPIKSDDSTIATARLSLISHNIMTSDVTRRFAAETVNYFAGESRLFWPPRLTIAGNHLNRCSHLRQNNEYLSYVLTHPSTKFLALNNLDCLCDAVFLCWEVI